MYDDIVKYIPYGRENAISRDDLAIKVGCSDRIMRDLISKARKKTVIINIQNGSGYYRPTENDMEDVLKYKHQEENRATEVFGNLQPVREFIRKYGRGSKTGTQGLKGAVQRSVIPEELCLHIADICM